MLKFNFIIAWRNIRKNKVFSLINIFGLSLGIACCMAIGQFVWSETHHDTIHKNLKTIYRVTNQQVQAGNKYHVAVTPGPLAPALQEDFAEINNTVRFGNWGGSLKYGDKVYGENSVQLTENSIFSVFNFRLIMGNPKTALLSPDEIVITENTAARYFGAGWRNNPSLIGQQFLWNDETNFKLAGIAANPPGNSSIQFDVLLPIAYLFATDKWSNKWGSNNYHTYLQLKAGTNIKAFGQKLSRQLKKYKPDTEDVLLLQPLEDQYLHSKFDFFTDWGKRSDIKYVKIFSAVGVLLLIIACVNFINLSTARSLKRSLEVGIRKVNGASKTQLVFQFLNESVLMALMAGCIAALLLKITQPLFQQFTGIDLQLSLSGANTILLFVLFTVFIGLTAGIYPAFILSAFKPVSSLKGKLGLRSGVGFRSGLMVFQFAISITLMICTFFMYRQLKFMQNKNLGFNSEQVIRVGLGKELKQKAALLKSDLEGESTIEAVAPSTMSLANVDNSSNMEWEGMLPGEEFLITQANVDPGFLPALGIGLVSGTNFSWQSNEDSASYYIVNETAVKMMGSTADKILGKKVTFWGAKGSIIGVVKDFHFKPLQAGIEPFIFRYQPWSNYFNLFVKTKPGKTAEAIRRVEQLYKKYEPESPFEFSFLNESLHQLYKNEQRTAGVIFLFALLTVLVGCLGLFGLTVYAAELRVKEIGIRKVLGAGVAGIVALLSKDFLRLVLLAIIIAIPVAGYFSYSWLNDYAYRINMDWWVFALMGVLAMSIAVVTVSFQSVKAAMANPVKSLRTE